MSSEAVPGHSVVICNKRNTHIQYTHTYTSDDRQLQSADAASPARARISEQCCRTKEEGGPRIYRSQYLHVVQIMQRILHLPQLGTQCDRGSTSTRCLARTNRRFENDLRTTPSLTAPCRRKHFSERHCEDVQRERKTFAEHNEPHRQSGSPKQRELWYQ